MSTKSIPAVGDRVRVRPFFCVPESPWCGRSMCSPYFYPGTVVEILSTEGTGIVVDLDPNDFGVGWSPRQAFSPDEIHPNDCDRGDCGNDMLCADPRRDIAKCEALNATLRAGDVVVPETEAPDASPTVWIGHRLGIDGIAAVLAYEFEWRSEYEPHDYPQLTRADVEEYLQAALTWRGLESMASEYPEPQAETRAWAQQQAKQLFGP